MPVMHVTDAVRNAILDAVRGLIDAGGAPGTINIYDGVMPWQADTEVGDQKLLASLQFGYPAAPQAKNGNLKFDSVEEDPSAEASGKATWARVMDAEGNLVFDCDVTVSGYGGAIELNTVDLVIGGPVRLTSVTLTARD